MKKIYIFSLMLLMIFSSSLTRANNEQPQGIDLGEHAFGIPVNQLSFGANSPFTLSFWFNIKEFNYCSDGKIQLLSIRNVNENYPFSDIGMMWIWINKEGTSTYNSLGPLYVAFRNYTSTPNFGELKDTSFGLKAKEWIYFSIAYDYDGSNRSISVYANGELVYYFITAKELYWKSINNTILIGGPSLVIAPLNAYIDKVQFYKKALSQAEVKESMSAPLLNDAALHAYWDFEGECTPDDDGFITANNGTTKATMYKILTNSYGESSDLEVQPFVFGEGVDPESVIQGIEENVAEESNPKAYVSNGVLNIENIEGITSVVVYDATGKVISSANANGATSTQIALSSTIKGMIMVKVNSEIVKVICN